MALKEKLLELSARAKYLGATSKILDMIRNLAEELADENLIIGPHRGFLRVMILSELKDLRREVFLMKEGQPRVLFRLVKDFEKSFKKVCLPRSQAVVDSTPILLELVDLPINISRRQAQILQVLANHPDGLMAEQLAELVYGTSEDNHQTNLRVQTSALKAKCLEAKIPLLIIKVGREPYRYQKPASQGPQEGQHTGKPVGD